jgi:hypothetical protein
LHTKASKWRVMKISPPLPASRSTSPSWTRGRARHSGI